MTKELAWLNLSWSGDAAWAIEEAAEIGVELDYSIPKDGSVVWFDGWVIPKYAKNIEAARYFINFMCKPENAVRNMDVIGYVSTISSSEVLEYMSDQESYEPIDVSYFFGEDAVSVPVDPIMYPDSETIRYCGMMHDTGTEELLKMWSRVKGANASAWTYILIVLVLGGLIFAVCFKYYRKNYRRKKYTRRK
jgi:spermidine/putrescine transport system substrate-binding protein